MVKRPIMPGTLLASGRQDDSSIAEEGGSELEELYGSMDRAFPPGLPSLESS